jgi:hypothetical protein
MLDRLFPKQIDNNFRGHVLAIWILTPIVLMKMLMGVNVAGLNPWISSRFVLQTADGIPIDTFGAQAGAVAVFFFASWGLALFVISLLGVVVLIRYRAMIPLMYSLLSIEQLGRKGLLLLHPLASTGATVGLSPGFWINAGLSTALVIGFILSVLGSKPDRSSANPIH